MISTIRRLGRVVKSRLPKSAQHRIGVAYHSIRGVEPELRVLLNLPRRRLFVDIGANIGLWSARAAGRFDRVACFEPDQALAAYLDAVLPANVTVHAVGLSDHAGEAQLATPIISGLAVSSRASVAPGVNGPVDNVMQTVPLARLDDFDLRGVDVIKVDVEGHEAAVIAGAKQTIARERPAMVIEIEERHHPGASEKLIGEIVRSDYDCGYILRGSLQRFQPGTIDTLQAHLLTRIGDKAEDYINNFVFWPLERPDLADAIARSI